MPHQGFVFPELLAAPEERPGCCPWCQRVGMGRHRGYRRAVVDLKVAQVEVVQYQCEGCGKSVTVNPPGLGWRCRQSQRTKAISVVLWALGLSYRNVERVMKGLGMAISDVGVLKNVRAMGKAELAAHEGGGGGLLGGSGVAVVEGEGEGDAGLVGGLFEVDGGVEAAAEQDDGRHSFYSE